jgi:adenylyltransferase/sulfurtransferase
LLGIGETLAGRLMIYDALGSRFEQVKFAWDPGNALSGRNATIKDLSIHAGGASGAVCVV